MFKNTRPVVFDSGESSDENDDIATDSTAESAELEHYPVEHILAEEEIAGKGLQYLIKWEGYPLARATWEPAENITARSIWRQWEQRKQLVEDGSAEPFDVVAYLDAVAEYQQRKAERHERRKIKRRKRGLPESPNRFEDSDADGTDEHNDDNGQSDVSPKPTHERTDSVQRTPSRTVARDNSTPARKGVARRLSRRQRVESSASSSDDQIADRRRPHSPTRKAVRRSRTFSEAAAPNTVSAGSTTAPHRSVSIPEPRTKTLPQTSSHAAPLAARKSAPGGAAANAPLVTDRDLLANWEAKKSKRQRPRVSGVTPKDSSDPKFRKLSTQNRFQKYSRNEKEPDINALKLVDLQTGQVMPPKATATPSAYLRRTPPPVEQDDVVNDDVPRGRQASVNSERKQCLLWQTGRCPNSAASCPHLHVKSTCHFWFRKGGCAMGASCSYAHEDTGFYAPAPGAVSRLEPSRNDDATARVDGARRHDASGVVVSTSASASWLDKKQITCYFWQHTFCKHADDQCDYAHRDTGTYADAPPNFKPRLSLDAHPVKRPSFDGNPATRPAPPKETTCYYWRRGRCKKRDDECNFAHRDTGVYAGQPGTFKEGSRAPPVPVGPNEAINANLVPVAPRPALPLSTQTPVTNDSIPLQTRDHPSNAVRSPPTDIVASPSLRRSSMAIETLDSDLLVSFASNDPPLQLRATLVTYNLAKLNEIAGPRPHLKVSQMIVAADFEKYVHNEAAGRFNASAVGGMTIGNHIASQELSSMCKLNTCGFIATVDHASKMLIYPSDAEGWKFLEEPGVKFDTPLTFRLLQALESADVSPLAVEDNLRSPIISICQDLAKVDTERLFKKKDGQVDVKTVFLMFPPTRQTELEIYVDFFAALGTRVYTSAMPGAWAYFRKIPRGNLLVIHADVPIWRIPGLFSFLTTTTSKVFRVGQSNGGFERLCPYGTAVLIPDDLFVYHPDDALDIIQEYLVRHKRKNDGAEFDRIVARPGVKPWLEKLALQHWQEDGRKDSRWIKLYHAICQLCPPDAEDPDDLPNPLPTSWLISLSPELLPSYEALWKKDEDQATEYLVNWYAGWSIEHVNSFRKLYIARPNHSGGSSEHESLDPKGWGNRYQHVGAKHAKDCFPK